MRPRLSLLFGAALVVSAGWIAVNGGSSSSPVAAVPEDPASFACTVASVTDGDTLRCLDEDADGRQIRVRLSGISAREADGTCGEGHPCPAATAEAATAELERLAGGRELLCQANGMSYRRVAAFCRRSVDGLDVNCAMVASGTAARWERYWRDHRC